VLAVTDLHCAWGGRLCLHPFNLGFLIALSRESEIPNLKAFPLPPPNKTACGCAPRVVEKCSSLMSCVAGPAEGGKVGCVLHFVGAIIVRADTALI